MDEMLNKNFVKFALGFIAIVLMSLVVIAVSSMYLGSPAAVTGGSGECPEGETC